jgi:hypothetical protein
MGFHLLRRAGYEESFIAEVARVMEYSRAYDLYRSDVEGWPRGAGRPQPAAAGATNR